MYDVLFSISVYMYKHIYIYIYIIICILYIYIYKNMCIYIYIDILHIHICGERERETEGESWEIALCIQINSPIFLNLPQEYRDTECCWIFEKLHKGSAPAVRSHTLCGSQGPQFRDQTAYDDATNHLCDVSNVKFDQLRQMVPKILQLSDLSGPWTPDTLGSRPLLDWSHWWSSQKPRPTTSLRYT